MEENPIMLDQNGIRKAAVFLNGLDWETASLLLKKLPAEESKAIRREMVAVEGISTGEINKTVKSFLQETRYGQADSGKKHAGPAKTVFSGDGIDLFELTGERRDNAADAAKNPYAVHGHGGNVSALHESEAVKPNDTNHSKVQATEEQTAIRRFDYLEQMSPFDTARFLAEEGEQLIAVVLSQLTPRYSGDVLACFEQSLKMSLIRRLAKLDATDEMIIDEIDLVLKERLQREAEEMPKTKPGLALLEQILQVIDNEVGNDIISGLNEIDREEEQQTVYYEQFDDCDPITFDELAMLDDCELEMLFRGQRHDIVAKSLVACDELFVVRVLGRFPVYEQITLRRMLHEAATSDADEQMYAQQCVMQAAIQLIEDGQIAEIPVYSENMQIDSRSVLVDYSV